MGILNSERTRFLIFVFYYQVTLASARHVPEGWEQKDRSGSPGYARASTVRDSQESDNDDKSRLFTLQDLG